MILMIKNTAYKLIKQKQKKMKFYTKPTIEVIVTSQEVLELGTSDSVGDGNEFTNNASFEENALGIDAEDIKGNLWDKD